MIKIPLRKTATLSLLLLSLLLLTVSYTMCGQRVCEKNRSVLFLFFVRFAVGLSARYWTRSWGSTRYTYHQTVRHRLSDIPKEKGVNWTRTDWNRITNVLRGDSAGMVFACSDPKKGIAIADVLSYERQPEERTKVRFPRSKVDV